MKISSIKVPKRYLNTATKNGKVMRYQSQEGNVVINQYNYLVDGYSYYQYCQLCGIEDVRFKQVTEQERILVIGRHDNSAKEFTWYTYDTSIQPGDRLFVKTKCGKQIATCTRIVIEDVPDIAAPNIKKVISKIN